MHVEQVHGLGEISEKNFKLSPLLPFFFLSPLESKFVLKHYFPAMVIYLTLPVLALTDQFHSLALAGPDCVTGQLFHLPPPPE